MTEKLLSFLPCTIKFVHYLIKVQNELFVFHYIHARYSLKQTKSISNALHKNKQRSVYSLDKYQIFHDIRQVIVLMLGFLGPIETCLNMF